eukprot:4737472-Prymnesium_polylepis.1
MRVVKEVASVFVALAMPGTPGLRCAKHIPMCARYAHVAIVHVALRPRAPLPPAPTNTRPMNNP